MLDFGMLPPEVNSARIYTGPGSGPMLAAASAWDALTWQLDSFATGYSSVISELHGHAWSGGSALAMIAAAAPYVAWASATATATEQTAVQARAAAAAFDAAFAATVPPPVVAANRVQLATLVATNFFGQNTAAIAATELAYAEMWAQDAAAMYGYAAAAATAAALAPFHEPPNTTRDTAAAGQAAAVAKAAVSAADQPDPFAALVSGTMKDLGGLNTLAKPEIFVADTIRSAGQWGNYILALVPAAKAAPAPAAAAVGEFGLGAAGLRPIVLAGVGQAAPVGGLSVPSSWPSAPINAAVPPAQSAAAHPPVPTAEAGRPGPRAGTHLPPAGMAPMSGLAGRRKGYPVLRMRDRRFRMPRPAVGG